MSFFSIMLYYVALPMGALYVWKRWFAKKKGEDVIVTFSEVVGEEIIEDDEQYEGLLIHDKNIFSVGAKKFKRPIPPRHLMRPTKTGKKKINIILFEKERVGYRVPHLSNTVFTYKRDKKGEIIKSDGVPMLQKHEWQFCDDVVEPDMTSWADNMDKEVREKHRIMISNLERWIGPVTIMMIFIFTVIALQITSKNFMADKAAILKEVQMREEQATSLIRNVDFLLEKATGQKVLQTDQPDEQTNQEKGSGQIK